MTVFKPMYVVGFAFLKSVEPPSVLLVKKNPRRESMKWQAGLWNGVGGAVNPGETPEHAMHREWVEETTHDYDIDWRLIAVETGRDYSLHAFAGVFSVSHPMTPDVNDAGETMMWISVADVGRYNVLGNLRWMLPLALDPREFSAPFYAQPLSDISKQPTWGVSQ